jgi:hypothetical protein
MKKSFKTLAAKKQEQFKTTRLKIKDFDVYPTMLKDEDALSGQLYNWPGLVDEVTKAVSFETKEKKVKAVFKNMLRSEHIPYNFFVPLKMSIEPDQENVLNFFSHLLDRQDLKEVKEFRIEWPGKVRHLEDNTSFDTYVHIETRKGTLGLGIEIKYTEKSYPYGKTEKERLELTTKASPYYKWWDKVKCYKEGSYLELGKKNLKQFFRNHLLGMAMQKSGEVTEFISLHLYPSGNEYQKMESLRFQSQLKSEFQNTFIPLTFEDFIATGKKELIGDNFQLWLKYLEDRYVI